MSERWQYIIKDEKKLSKLLWLDIAIGATLGVSGLLFYPFFSQLVGIPENIFIWISAITLFYSLCVIRIARKPIYILFLWIKLGANALWAIIIIGIMSLQFTNPTTIGHVFFAFHIIVAAGLGWLERNQIDKEDAPRIESL